MFRWLNRLVDRTPQLTTDDLEASTSLAAPPPPPPEDLTAQFLTDQTSFHPNQRAQIVTRPTKELEALAEKVFQHFRSSPDELPTFPALAIQIFEMLERPREEIKVDQLVRVVSREPATSAIILRVANSSRFGGVQSITSVRDAVVRLGIAEVANLAVAAASKSLFDASQATGLSQFERFWSRRWRHSLTTAFSASWLSMETRTGQPQQAFIAGLLHDLGKSLALRAMTDMAINGTWRRPLTPAGVEFVMETTHVDLGAEAAVQWGLPDFIVEVCQEHHADDVSGLPAVVSVASDAYELMNNPLYRLSLTQELVNAATTLGVHRDLFARLNTEVTSFAATADEMAGKTAAA